MQLWNIASGKDEDMKIAISAAGPGMEAPVDERFGRALKDYQEGRLLKSESADVEGHW